MKSITDYKFWLIFFLLSYVLVDMVRRLFGGTQLLLVVLDISLLASYFFFFPKNKVNLTKGNYRLLIVTLMLYAFMITLQLANPVDAELFARIAAYRSYLLAIPLIWVGYGFTKQEQNDFGYLTKLLLGVSIGLILFAAFQFYWDSQTLSGTLSLLMKPMEHEFHGFEETPQKLISGPFASSWRYTVFLLFSYLLIWGVRASQKETTGWLFVLFLFGLFLGGNRTSLSLFLVFNLAIWVVFNPRKFLLFMYISVLSSLIIALYASYLSFRVEQVDILDQETLTRLDYFTESPEKYLLRAEMALPFLVLRTDNPHVLFGVGLGSFGQESASFSSFIRQKQLVAGFFYQNPSRPIADSGYTKLLIEVGVIGTATFSLFFGVCLYYSLTMIFKATIHRDPLLFSIAALPILWFMVFLKGHPTISDIGVSFMLFLSVGFVLAKMEEYAVAFGRRADVELSRTLQFGSQVTDSF